MNSPPPPKPSGPVTSSVPASDGAANADAGPRFEALMAELDAIVGRLERGEVPLEAALEGFERGMSLARQAGGLLDRAEARLAVLSEDLRAPRDAAGQARPGRETPMAFPTRDPGDE